MAKTKKAAKSKATKKKSSGDELRDEIVALRGEHLHGSVAKVLDKMLDRLGGRKKKVSEAKPAKETKAEAKADEKASDSDQP